MNLNLVKCRLLTAPLLNITQRLGMKNFSPPPNYDNIEIPEKPKLRFMDKVPQYPPMVKPPKMQKKLRLMRGPELVHNTLLHKQFGILAIGGGRIKYSHLEVIRLGLGRKLDYSRMFAVWRVDAPWQPITKKGQGQRMGGGKGGIDHYVTPIKPGRIILEVGGKCEWIEVKKILTNLANKMPFDAIAVSQEIMDEMKRKEIEDERNNVNPYTMKYLIQNNMGGCQRWLSPTTLKYCGKYL